MRFREEQPPGDEADAISRAYEALSRRVAKARAEQHRFGVAEGYQLVELEFHHLQQVYFNLSVPELVEHALMNGEGGLSDGGALCVKTVPYGTRSPQNTLVVDLGAFPESLAKLEANTQSNAETELRLQPTVLSEQAFRHLYQEAQAYVQGRSLYVIDGELGSGTSVRVVTELASQALFVKQLLYPVGGILSEESGSEGASHSFTHLSPVSNPSFHRGNAADQNHPVHSEQYTHPNPAGADPEIDSALELDPNFLPLTLIVLPGLKGEARLESELQSEVFNALYPVHRLGLVGGSRNCDEVRAALLWLAGAVVPQQDKLLLWEAAIAQSHDSSRLNLWLGPQLRDQILPTDSLLTLEPAVDQVAAAPVFAGDYAPIVCPTPKQAQELGERFSEKPRSKSSDLNPYKFGSLLENVVLDSKTGTPNLQDYRWGVVPRHAMSRQTSVRYSGQIQTLIIGLDDPEAIFPPLVRLTPEQAKFYYLCGYGNWLGDDICDRHGQRLNAQQPAYHSHSFRTCFAAEMTMNRAIAQVLALGTFIRQHRPQLLLRNTATAGLTTIQQALKPSQIHEIPMLEAAVWARQIGGSPEKHELAQQLFRRFNKYASQFFESLPHPPSPTLYPRPSENKAELPASIQRAGPRL